MLSKSILSPLLAIILLLGNLPLAAQPVTGEPTPDSVPVLLQEANKAYADKDYLALRKTLQKLNQMRPYNSEYMYQLVNAHALLNEKSEAYELMLLMQQQGLAYDFSKSESTASIRNTEVFDYVNDLMKMAAEPIGEAETVFTLPGEVFMPSTISWDESRQKFLVGTADKGKVLAVNKDGQVTELLGPSKENGLWGIFDILVDQDRNRLWISSAATPGYSDFDPVDRGRSALFEFELESLKMIRRHPVPVDGRPHILGSMVQSPDGDIYIADRSLPIIYKKPAGEERLKALLASSEMVSMRGIAIQPDGRLLYIADREMGILIADLEAGKAAKLVGPETLNLGGIDGLYLWDNHLIIIQNGISPQRIMRLQLDASGTQVAAVRPLAVARPEFDYPTYGAMHGEDLFYFANSQLAKTQGVFDAVTVMRTPLNSSKDLEGPDMVEYLRKRGEAQRKSLEEKKPD